MKAVVFALGFLMLWAPFAAAEEATKWTVSVSGGSKIEIPALFADGESRLLGGFAENLGTAFEPEKYPGVQLRQYQADTNKKSPFDYIKKQLVGDTDRVTYNLDKPSVAVIPVHRRMAQKFSTACARKTVSSPVSICIGPRTNRRCLGQLPSASVGRSTRIGDPQIFHFDAQTLGIQPQRIFAFHASHLAALAAEGA
ncbi:hypothetical protein [Mesorhizobium sp. WSM3868]|uniref:hypothetical protein n=1 Tax=Mesorhizobium sp. WSM3868 TaxID=2029405 RepID=UPI00117F9225|nr:hypothetical protein [Mesorhizobium sp. WSM3868]